MENRPVPVPSLPGGAPLIGHLPKFVRDPLGFLTGLSAYGDMVFVRFGTKKLCFVTSGELVTEMVVKRNREIQRGEIFEKTRALIGNSLIVSDGDFHLRQRRLIMPAFHLQRIRRCHSTMLDAVSTWMRSIQQGDVIDFGHEMHRLTCPSITRNLFRYDVADDTISTITRLISILASGFMWRMFLPDFMTRIPSTKSWQHQTALLRLQAIVRTIIEQYRHRPSEGDDLLSMLMAAADDESGEGMGDDQLEIEVLTMLLAGTETAASTLTWIFYELGRHPDIFDRLVGEIDNVLQGRAPEAEDMPKLVYGTRVVKEALRLYSPTWLLTREAIVATELGGFELPAGTEVAYSPLAIHRSPVQYDEPREFDPDRWGDIHSRPNPNPVFIPFSVGQHKCVGDNFALAEIHIFLTMIAQRWRVVPTNKYRSVFDWRSPVMHPKPLAMRLENREMAGR